MDQFTTRLRQLAAHCEFADIEKELRAAIIMNCLSKRLRRFGLREEDMTLDKLLSKRPVHWRQVRPKQVGWKIPMSRYLEERG